MLLKKNKNFFLIWQGQLISQIGSKIYLIALSWYFVAKLNNNNSFVIIMLISSLPGLLLGLFIGPFIDKWNKKYIIVISDLISGLLVLFIAGIIFFKVTNPIYIYIPVFFLSISTIFFNPAVTSIIPSIVKKDELQEGISLNTMVLFIAQFVGSAFGGILVAFLGVFGTILFNAISYILSAISEMFIKYKFVEIIDKKNHFKELIKGLEYLKVNNDILRQIIIFGALNFFIVPIIVFLPILIDDYLKLSSVYYGISDAGMPIGAILVSIILTKVKVKDHIRALKTGLLLISISFFLIYFGKNVYFIIIAMFVFGLFLNLININAISFYTKNIASEYRGRFFTLLDTISFSSFPFAYLITGLLIQHFNIYNLIFLNGIIMLFIGVFSVFFIKGMKQTKGKKL